jgi:PBP1b-binding outer membrane lipoprotein LpoB
MLAESEGVLNFARMLTRKALFICFTIGGHLLMGCASAPRQVAISEMRTSMGLDPVDVVDVATQMAESMLATNVFRSRGSDGRSVVAFSTFRNNTSLEGFDPNLIFNRVSVILNRTGTAYVHGAEDPLVGKNRARLAAANREIEAKNELLEFTGSKQRIPKHATSSAPNYSIGIELIEAPSQVGNTVQVSFQIHMTVTDVQRGVVAWEDVRDVSKRYR